MWGPTRTVRCWPLGEGELILVRMPTKKEEQIPADILPFPSFMFFFHGFRALEASTILPLLSVLRAPPPLPQWSTVQQEAKLL